MDYAVEIQEDVVEVDGIAYVNAIDDVNNGCMEANEGKEPKKTKYVAVLTVREILKMVGKDFDDLR